MAKKSKNPYPHRIDTDHGEAVVKVIPSSLASKVHKCLFCEYETDFYEKHIIILPVAFTGNRRYAHLPCYEEHRESGEMVKMHPYAPNLAPGPELWQG